MSPTIVALTLLLTSAFGFYALWGFSSSNGLFEYIPEMAKTLFPDSANPATLTGISALDEQLKVLVSFFWPVIDGSSPDLSLHAVNFMFQGATMWLLLMVEGLRRGNDWRVVSFITTFGLFMQNIGFAAMVPAFLALHLWTSPTAERPTPENLWIDPKQLVALPVSLVLGLFVPSVAMSLPAPAVISVPQKQNLAAFWQAFPLWVYAVQQVVATLISTIAPAKSKSTPTEKNHAFVQSAPWAYTFGIGCSACGHIGTWSISLFAMLFPQLFAPGVAELLDPSNVFLNASPFSGIKAADIAEGSKWFLQWDLLVGSTAVLLWATALRVQADTPRSSLLAFVSQFVFLLLVSAVIGPSGAAIVAVWTRDEVVFGRSGKAKSL